MEMMPEAMEGNEVYKKEREEKREAKSKDES